MSANQRRVQRSTGQQRSTSQPRKTTRSNVPQRSAARRPTQPNRSSAAAQTTRTRAQQTGSSVRAPRGTRPAARNHYVAEEDTDSSDSDSDSFFPFNDLDDDDDDDYDAFVPGMRFADIDRATTTSKYSQSSASSRSSTDEDLCSICWEAFRARQCIRKLSCGHEFHSTCVVRWLRRQATCPNCRKKILLQRYGL